MTCKADFPKTALCLRKSVVICRGVAKKLKLRVSGRRNSFGGHAGKRTCQWQSGTTVSFAVGIRSNTHTLPNWRLPPLREIHANDICQHPSCLAAFDDPSTVKVSSKIGQRAQRQCTGYYCGYTFKPQPVGRKFTRLAAESLNYVVPQLKDRTSGQRWHRITHRVLSDQQNHCMKRPAPE